MVHFSLSFLKVFWYFISFFESAKIEEITHTKTIHDFFESWIMDAVELTMLFNLYVVLQETLVESSFLEVLNTLAMELAFVDDDPLSNIQIVIVVAKFHDYRLQSGLSCFEDNLRY